MKIKKRSAKFWLITATFAVLLLAGSGYAARRYGVPAVKRWRVAKMNTEARAFLAKGDSENALLLARKSVAMGGQSADAWRIAVAAAKLKKTADVVYYQNELCRAEPTKQNYIELIRVSLEFQQYYYALEGVKAAAKDSSGDADYHRMAVELYEKLGRPTAAKYHLLSLASLAPTDRLVQLKVAAIEMSEDPQRTNREIRSRVRNLADDPLLRPQAISMLLREAIDSKSLIDAGELLARLKAIQDLSLERQLLVIEASALVSPDSVDGLLERLKAKVADSPQDTAGVLNFLRDKGNAAAAWSWYRTLPEKTQKNESVMLAAGEALFAYQNWVELETFTRSGNWGEVNYLRQAFHAYASRQLGHAADFTESWKLAVLSAGSELRRAGELLRRVDSWKWREEHYDVLWKIFALLPRDNSVRQDLIGWEKSQNHTVNLNKLFATIVQLDPGDNVARNNLAYTSLLLDSNLGQAILTTDELLRLEPYNPFFATTRSFALYKQGKFQEALHQIQSLPFAERSVPERILLESVYLAKVGEAERAKDLLSGLVLRNFLPEEQKLYAAAQADILKIARNQVNLNRLQALNRGAETGGWLGLMDAATQRDATVEMKLADSAYAHGDLAGLTEMLSKANWGAYQYLQSALMTYVRRQKGTEVPRDWRQTLELADRNLVSVQNLLRLVSQWSWEPERIETLGKVFEKNPRDRLVMAELFRYYRENNRLGNVLKVLSLHLAAIDGESDERADFAYYSLLAGQNVGAAQVAAGKAYEMEPDNVKRGLIHAFGLWSDKRYSDAAAVLKLLPENVKVEGIPRPLIAAAIQSETATPEVARASLKAFDAKAALSEEIALAEKINQRLIARERSL